jgi:hypothetical protein
VSDMLFSMRPLSYGRKSDDHFFIQLPVTVINSRCSVTLYTIKNVVEGRGTCIPAAVTVITIAVRTQLRSAVMSILREIYE